MGKAWHRFLEAIHQQLRLPYMNQTLGELLPGIPLGNVESVDGRSYTGCPAAVDRSTVEITGWFVDSFNDNAASFLFLDDGKTLYPAEYGCLRLDVAEVYSNTSYRYSGFIARIDVSDFPKGEHSIAIIIGDCHGTGYYRYDRAVILELGATHRFDFKGWIAGRYGFLVGFLTERWFILSLAKNILSLMFLKASLHLTLSGKKLIVINLDEHIGDIVACEPVSRILRGEHPCDYIVWITRYKFRELVRYNPNLNQVFGVTCLFEWMILKRLLRFDRTVDLHIHNRRCTSFDRYLVNPNDYGITLDNYFENATLLEAFMMAANLVPQDRSPIFHLNPDVEMEVEGGTVVFHCSSNEVVKDWDLGKFNRLAQRLIEEGYCIAEVGLKNKIDLDGVKGYINYCGKIGFQQIANLIQKSALFVGIDSSFAHFANAVGTPGVILLGHYRAFKGYMPYSGAYRDGSNAVVIQHDGLVRDIPEEEVYAAAKSLLKQASRKENRDNII